MAEARKPQVAPAGTQLALLEVARESWRLDDQTREIGRRGVADARAALRLAGEHRLGQSHRPGRAEAA